MIGSCHLCSTTSSVHVATDSHFLCQDPAKETTVALSFFVTMWEVASGLKGHSSNKISTFGKSCWDWDMGNSITLLELPLYVYGESDIQTDTLVSLIQMWYMILTGVPTSWFFVFSQFMRVITRLCFCWR